MYIFPYTFFIFASFKWKHIFITDTNRISSNFVSIMTKIIQNIETVWGWYSARVSRIIQEEYAVRLLDSSFIISGTSEESGQKFLMKKDRLNIGERKKLHYVHIFSNNHFCPSVCLVVSWRSKLGSWLKDLLQMALHLSYNPCGLGRCF